MTSNAPDVDLEIERVKIKRVDHAHFDAEATVYVSQGYVLLDYVVIEDVMKGTPAHKKLNPPRVYKLLERREFWCCMGELGRDPFSMALTRAVLTAYRGDGGGDAAEALIPLPTKPPSRLGKAVKELPDE